MAEMSESLEALQRAIQEHASQQDEDSDHTSVIVTNAIVIWEQSGLHEDGTMCTQVLYSVPTDSLSITASLGLIEAGGTYVRRDILGLDGEEED